MPKAAKAKVTRTSRSKAAAASAEAEPAPEVVEEVAPALPDEQPPLPVEQPPLPTEQPPLPTEQPPLPTGQPPLPSRDEPVAELGGEDEEEENDDKDQDEPPKDKGKGKAEPSTSWQAVWAPEKNAYYFWNTESGEVTWTNPLAPEDAAPPLPTEPAPPLPSGPAPTAIQTAQRSGTVPDIDPALAHLLPPEQRGGDTAGVSAMFNARTGRFTPNDYSYTVGHLDEYNRAKRMSEHYFDVEGWERSKAAEHAKRRAEEAAGVSHDKKITKKDMDRFRRKKAEQKARSQAWLHD